MGNAERMMRVRDHELRKAMSQSRKLGAKGRISGGWLYEDAPSRSRVQEVLQQLKKIVPEAYKCIGFKLLLLLPMSRVTLAAILLMIFAGAAGLNMTWHSLAPCQAA